MLYHAFIVLIIIIVIILYKKIEKFTMTDATNTTKEILKSLGNVYGKELLKVGQLRAENYYPVGSVYLSQKSTNPATVLGFGTWSQLSGGYLYLDIPPNTNVRGDNHIMPTNLPQHTHNVTFEANWNKGGWATNNGSSKVGDTSWWGSQTTGTTLSRPVDSAYVFNEFRPKYITLCAWYRIA